jgi:hypothetical protein
VVPPNSSEKFNLDEADASKIVLLHKSSFLQRSEQLPSKAQRPTHGVKY